LWVVPQIQLFFVGSSSDPIIKKYQKNNPPIPEFLSKGNLFWYSLPDGYSDMGPRVILEAMASGLPVIADNWGGAVDRVTPETGWLCSEKSQYAEIIAEVTLKDLKQKGNAARQRAHDEFSPEKWMEVILG
jgi:glycosyltransferase involved in cell wall biosynthesis